jgi:hypothetical protein
MNDFTAAKIGPTPTTLDCTVLVHGQRNREVGTINFPVESEGLTLHFFHLQ